MLDIVTPLSDYLHRVGLHEVISEDELRIGLAQIEIGFAHAVYEASTALARQMTLSEAGRQIDAFPVLATVHGAVTTFARLPVPSQFMPLMRRARVLSEQGSLDEIRDALAVVARAADADPAERVAAQLLCYQAIRLNLYLMADSFGPERLRLGYEEEDLDEMAEEQLRELLETEFDMRGLEHPFEDTIVRALCRFARDVEDRLQVIESVARETRELFDVRAEVERQTQMLDPVDRELLENRVAPVLGREKRSIRQLRQIRPLTVGQLSEDALYQRQHRLLERMTKGSLGALHERAEPSVLEMMLDEEESK